MPRGNRKDDPAAVIEGPKRGRALPKVLSVSHVDQLLATAREGMARRRRDRASGCAPRGSIACSKCFTRPACASPSWSRCRRPRRGATQRMLIVRGKGDKERLVPLNESAKRAMRDYLALREEAAKPQQGRDEGLEMAVSRRSARAAT